jgi:glycosyltransferase involved in cell wall biosynthesis
MQASGTGDQEGAMRSLFLSLGPGSALPWWWEEIKVDSDLCDLDYARITVRNKRSKEISTVDLPWLFLKVLRVLLRSRSRHDYIFTVENDFNSFAVSFWQTVLFLRRPRHVILTFIMREKTPAISSRLKFLLMRFLFSSVHKVISASRTEVDYYTNVFHWPAGKAGFVPLLVAGGLLDSPTEDSEGFIFSGGRVYRDYDTLIRALDGSGYRAIVVSEGDVPALRDHPRIETMYRIPLEDFNSLVARSRIVVLPLEDKPFSIGQTVLLQAMAMGKPVIATRTAGTVDYIEHLETGLLVEPHDPVALRKAIDLLMRDEGLRVKLARNAADVIRRQNLPHHYTRAVRSLLLDASRSSRRA